MAIVWLVGGVAFGWLLTKFAKLALLVFMATVLISYVLYHFDIIQLNTFAIEINMKDKLTPDWGMILKIPYAIAFYIGITIGRRYL